ncbi:uncharacterized protein LOC130113013 [Lampris incognitus]|uniref:uncharacterized protein LOC130113013 n=1 Tax=Lampris incognitus TaxID=2546036 RepID=UPI0024B49006|nr:uncharacterized protein LOC130113013 [Lampris incognitus]
MSGDDFQTRYATVMHSMLKSAVAETTKLFETMVDELKAEISRIKKENEDLKTKCNEFENAKNPKTSDEKESEPEQGPSNARDKCDHGVQCDLVPMRSVLMEQFSRPHQSRNSTIQKQVQQVDDTMNVGLQKEQRSETHGKGKTSKAFVLLKQEQGSNHDNSVPRYILLKQEDEVTTVAHRHAIHEIPDLQGAFIDHNTPEEHPVNHPSSVMEFGLNCERGGQSQTPEPEQPPVVTCPATEDNVEEQCEVAKQILKTFTTSATQVELPKLDENQPLFNAEHQLMVQHLEKEQASVVNKQLHRENERLVNEETLTMQTYVDVPSTTKLSEAAELTKETSFQEVEVGLAEVEISSQPAPSTSRRRGRPPKKFCKYWPQDKMTRLSSSDVPKLQKVIPLSSSWKENDHPFLSVPSSLPKRGRPPKKHGGSELPVQDSVPPPSNKLPCVRIAISTPSMEVKDIEFSPQPCAAVFPRDGNFKDELPVKVKEGVLQSPSIQTSSATETVKALSADSTRTPPDPTCITNTTGSYCKQPNNYQLTNRRANCNSPVISTATPCRYSNYS